MKYKLGRDQFARFFTSEEDHFKADYISLEHVNNGHAGRDRLYYLLKTLAYGITRDEVLDIVGSCNICQSRRGMVTRPIIRPIIARSPRERYIADLIDFRYYSDVNDGHKWMLVVVDSFSKYMWTTALRDKTSETVVSAIKTIFSINGASFLLHTDNGREFCNSIMRTMLEDFDLRHIRGRARCPWIQGQVERENQTIKWMIGSMLMSLDILGKWTTVREDATHAYNTMRHSTTSKTPFELMFGPPIRQLMQEDQIEAILHHDVGETVDVVEDVVEDIVENVPVDVLNPSQLPSIIPEEIDEVAEDNIFRTDEYIRSRNEARLSTQRSADRMVARSMWRNDYLEFHLGSRVLIRPDTDNNTLTRRMNLYEHLDTTVYKVTEILQFNKVKLQSEDNPDIIIEEIDIIRLQPMRS